VLRMVGRLLCGIGPVMPGVRRLSERKKRETCMALIRLALAVTLFIGSCAGLGYLGERWARRHQWPWYACFLLSPVIALIWPAIMVWITWYGASHYQPRDASDPGDAPVYVLMSAVIGAPIIFVISHVLTVSGIMVAQRGKPD
jgi:hypothetical protein